MNTGILKAEGLCKSYGSKRVLEGLDLTIQYSLYENPDREFF